MATIILPAMSAARRLRVPPRSQRLKKCRPECLPAVPSCAPSRRRSRCEIVMTSSITLRSRIAGNEARADALDLVRSRLAAGEDRQNLPARRAIILHARLRGLQDLATPVIVPPVPTPEITTSTPPSVSFQISSAVVWRWISGLAGFSNCCGMIAPGVVATISCAFAIAPLMPFAASVSSTSAPRSIEHLAPFDRHRFRHHEDQLVAVGGGDEGERDAGVAACRLDQRRFARRDDARCFECVDHGHADAILDAGDRVEEFQLGEDARLTSCVAGDAVKRDQGVSPMVSVID